MKIVTILFKLAKQQLFIINTQSSYQKSLQLMKKHPQISKITLKMSHPSQKTSSKPTPPKRKPVPPKSPQPSPSYAPYIEKMFETASTQIARLLKQLSSLYGKYGVRYDVTGCYDTVMRMLTPFELLAHFGLTDAGALLDREYIGRIFGRTGGGGAPGGVGMARGTPFSFGDFRSGHNQGSLSASISNEPNYSGFLQGSGQQQKPKFIHVRKRKPGTTRNPSLSQAQQISVQKYIIEQVQNGTVLTMQMIADEAKNILRGTKQFTASLGWVKNFLKRYPEMRELYDYSRTINKTSRVDELKSYRPQLRDLDYYEQEDRESKGEQGEEAGYEDGEGEGDSDGVDRNQVYAQQEEDREGQEREESGQSEVIQVNQAKNKKS